MLIIGAVSPKETRADAAQMADAESKMIILGIADSYERLAKRTEDRFRDAEKSK
jgi:hypothetical protein